jgi:hypothetical protein
LVRDSILWVLGAAWLGAVAAGFGAWERFERTPGAASSKSIVDAPAGDRWHLSLFVHPRCPCVRPMLDELNEIHAAAPDLDIRVVFVRPEGVEADWERGELWDAVRQMTCVEVVSDPDGAEAKRYGAKTSGQAVLMDPSGRAVFQGGLTRGRGTPGEGPGRRAVLQWIRDGRGAESAPVYGCPLFTPND